MHCPDLAAYINNPRKPHSHRQERLTHIVWISHISPSCMSQRLSVSFCLCWAETQGGKHLERSSVWQKKKKKVMVSEKGIKMKLMWVTLHPCHAGAHFQRVAWQHLSVMRLAHAGSQWNQTRAILCMHVRACRDHWRQRSPGHFDVESDGNEPTQAPQLSSTSVSDTQGAD